MNECCGACINLVPIVGGVILAMFVLGVILMTCVGIYEISRKNYQSGILFMVWSIGSFWLVWPVKDLAFRLAEAIVL